RPLYPCVYLVARNLDADKVRVRTYCPDGFLQTCPLAFGNRLFSRTNEVGSHLSSVLHTNNITGAHQPRAPPSFDVSAHAPANNPDRTITRDAPHTGPPPAYCYTAHRARRRRAPAPSWAPPASAPTVEARPFASPLVAPPLATSPLPFGVYR